MTIFIELLLIHHILYNNSSSNHIRSLKIYGDLPNKLIRSSQRILTCATLDII